MDRATLLQIFQSRLERSDYSKLQKQGRTFYQEARRQASNTKARRYIGFFVLFRAQMCYNVVCPPFRYSVSPECRRSGLVVVPVPVVFLWIYKCVFAYFYIDTFL